MINQSIDEGVDADRVRSLRDGEYAAMLHAVDLARSGPFHRRGGNPRVGCVLVDSRGAIVAEGHHRGAGSDHAEVAALRAAGRRAEGTTAVVTLEPCTHRGRTGPCTQALVDAGVARVVYGQSDPDPIAGGGAADLRAAGLSIAGPAPIGEMDELNTDWTFARRAGRPIVRLKIATTLDGRVAASDGSSRWITSEPARSDGHRWRDHSDAVMVGTGTVYADDPQLTVRIPAAQRRAVDQPVRAVFGRTPIPQAAAVRDTAADTVLLTTRSPAEALADLDRRGVRSVLIEGGPRVAAIFLRACLVDELISYLAPALLGAGPAAVSDLGITSIGQARRGRITDITSLGDGPQRCLRVTTRLTSTPSQARDSTHRS